MCLISNVIVKVELLMYMLAWLDCLKTLSEQRKISCKLNVSKVIITAIVDL